MVVLKIVIVLIVNNQNKRFPGAHIWEHLKSVFWLSVNRFAESSNPPKIWYLMPFHDKLVHWYTRIRR